MTFLGRLWRTEIVVLAALLDLGILVGLFFFFTVPAVSMIPRAGWNAFVFGLIATLGFGLIPALVGGVFHAWFSHRGWMRWWVSLLMGAMVGGVFMVASPVLGLLGIGMGVAAAGMTHWALGRILRRA